MWGWEESEGRSALFCIPSPLLLSGASLLRSRQEEKRGSGYLMWLSTRKMVIPSLLDAAASLLNPVRFSLVSMLEQMQVQAPSLVRLPGAPPCCPVPLGISCTPFTSSTRDPVNSLSWRGQGGPPCCRFSHLGHLSTAPSPCPRKSSTLLVLERPEMRDNHQSPTREGWASLSFICNSSECSSLDFERKRYFHPLYYSENAVKRGNRVSL